MDNEKLYDLWHDNGDSIWDVKRRALDEAGVIVLAKLVEEVLGVDPDGDAMLIGWVLG